MPTKIAGIKIDSRGLAKIIEKKQKLIRDNIATVLKKEAIPHLISKIMMGYDNLIALANTGPDDPTNPANWRTTFLVRLNEELERTFIVSGNKISVKLGERSFLGYSDVEEADPNDNEPLHWLVYYLEGLVGDWGFITPEIYKKLTRREYQAGWGRFNEGYMISKENYETNGWGRKIPFSQIRHPFSGFSPTNIFTEALREFNLRPFIQKAIKAAVQGRKL
jgi:hypothetical protein